MGTGDRRSLKHDKIADLIKLTRTRKLCYHKDDRAMRLIYEFWFMVENPNLGE